MPTLHNPSISRHVKICTSCSAFRALEESIFSWIPEPRLEEKRFCVCGKQLLTCVEIDLHISVYDSDNDVLRVKVCTVCIPSRAALSLNWAGSKHKHNQLRDCKYRHGATYEFVDESEIRRLKSKHTHQHEEIVDAEAKTHSFLFTPPRGPRALLSQVKNIYAPALWNSETKRHGSLRDICRDAPKINHKAMHTISGSAPDDLHIQNNDVSLSPIRRKRKLSTTPEDSSEMLKRPRNIRPARVNNGIASWEVQIPIMLPEPPLSPQSPAKKTFEETALDIGLFVAKKLAAQTISEQELSSILQTLGLSYIQPPASEFSIIGNSNRAYLPNRTRNENTYRQLTARRCVSFAEKIEIKYADGFEESVYENGWNNRPREVVTMDTEKTEEQTGRALL